MCTKTPPTECNSGTGIFITTSGFESDFFDDSGGLLRPWSSADSSKYIWKINKLYWPRTYESSM